ncbi:MAG: class I tRNA ligase family protein [Patescibacteria group bacterium]
MQKDEDKVLKSETAKREEHIVTFWKEQQIFQKSLDKHSPKGEYTFYDGPPFATGLPHHGSLLSSIIKDVIPRYKTMRGYHVPRRWGWDTHGLPIESMVEKKLDLKTKKDILTIGIDVFNETARASVLEYVHDWEKYIDRVGRFVDFKNSYKTMDNSFIESVWWGLKKLDNKGLLYEGRKVLMYCTHCETPLAKAEIQQDNTYKDITEEAVTAKFKVPDSQLFMIRGAKKANVSAVKDLPTYLLAWTTTPWTLPGNVGLAVGKDIDYVVVEKDGENVVMAKALMPEGLTAVSELRGSDIVGLRYEPLFDVPALRSGKSYKVHAADFVTTEDGTGIVHTAVMYGEDDFDLGKKEGLPMVQLLSANGTYNDNAPEFIRGEYIKKAEKIIKEDLEKRGLMFARAPHTHSYPHCYRCGTPLIYNAVGSWFINIQKIKSRMLKQNEKITWVPEHLKHGRFKHNVETAPDWTISRNRFWASPIPVWKEKGGKKLMVIGSLKELRAKTRRSGNTYFVMRHAHAQSNAEGVFDSYDRHDNHLTKEGREQAHESATKLMRETKIDMIITSPMIRNRETADIVRQVFGLPESAVMNDERLREIGVGVYNGKLVKEWRESFKTKREPFEQVPEGAETFTQVRQRIGQFIFEVEKRYPNKKILIVTHGCPGWLLRTVAEQFTIDECITDTVGPSTYLQNADIKKLDFVPYAHNKKFELDLHRPYIDEIELVDEKGRVYERVPEVLDCWVESGAMPFASAEYPRKKNKVNPGRFFGLFPKGYPADFIAEYIAQTRTWFYYMHVMGVALFGKSSFKAVVSTGTILAADGSKMSKSKGNYTDPLLMMHQFGADALRFYLMGSVVMSGEDLNFRDEDVREAHNRVVGMLWNCYKFFELYKNEYDPNVKAGESTHALDLWVRSRLNQTTLKMTECFDTFDTPGACKALRTLIDDYSTWYVRRSRERARGEDQADKLVALAVQHDALLTIARLAAPLMPFVAESIWSEVGGEEESVHLAAWPEPSPFDQDLLNDMEHVRELASRGLEARERVGIKVRQPLSKLTAKSLPTNMALREILADEVNVKEVAENPALEGEVELDITLTDELREEGVLRDLMRRVQEWRKKSALLITDRPSHTLVVSAEEKPVAEKYIERIGRETGLSGLTIEVQ